MAGRLVWSKTETPKIQILIPVLIIFIILSSAVIYAVFLYPEDRLLLSVILSLLIIFFILSAILPEGYSPY